MDHLKYKSEYLKSQAQIVTFTIEGKILASCDTLVVLEGVEKSIYEESFLLESIKGQILESEPNDIFEFFCMTDSLFSEYSHCDHRIEIIEEKGQRVVCWLIENHTNQYARVNSIQQERNDNHIENKALNNEQQNIERENASLKLVTENTKKIAEDKLQKKLEYDFKIPIKGLQYFSRNKAIDQNSAGKYEQANLMIANYLESAINRMSTVQKIRHIPFKIDQVIAAISAVFEGLNDTKLIFEKEFESSIVVGDKYQMFIDIVQLIGLILEQRPDGNIKIRCRYNESEKSIFFKFRSNLLTHSLKKVVSIYTEINEANGLSLDKSSVEIRCPVTEIKMLSKSPLNQQSRKAISQASFPYLYRISNKDLDMVKDIVEGIIDVVPIELEKMRKLNLAKDYNALARTAHKVKPNFESLDQKQFSKIINDIEDAALERNDEYLDQHVSEFIKSSSEKIEQIRNDYL